MNKYKTLGCRIGNKKMKEIGTLIREHPYLVNKTQFLQVAIQETVKNGTLKQHIQDDEQGTQTINCKISIEENELVQKYLLDHPLLENVSQFLKGSIDEFLINERKLLEKGVI